MKLSMRFVVGPLLALVSALYLVRGQLPAVGLDREPPSRVASDAAAVSLLRQSLASPHADARAAALEWISRNNESQDDSLVAPIFAALKDSDGGVRNQALANLGWIYQRHQNDDQGQRAFIAIEGALNETSASDADRSARMVAVDILRGAADSSAYSVENPSAVPNPLLVNPEIQSVIAGLLNNGQSGLRPQLLQVVAASSALKTVPAVIQGIGACLEDDDLSVRSNAVDLLIEIDGKGGDAARREAHPLLLTAREQGDPNVQLRASSALNLPIPSRRAAAPLVSLAGEKVAAADVPFDFSYFTAFVQPIFAKKYGNEACVDCHTPQTNASGAFRILAPGADRRYTLDQSRVNFVSMLSVIDRHDPTQSKLLLKPLDPRTQEGKLRGLEHDGGVFWTNQYDRDFEIVESWLKGAKIETPPEKQLDFAFFSTKVEPIFATPGPDGIACINCHSTHAILHLLSPPSREGQFSVEQVVNNYEAAHRVIDEAAPGNSFIVRKPTSLREGEAGGLSHAGGVRWPGKKDSWQYKTLIAWMGMHNLSEDGKQMASAPSR